MNRLLQALGLMRVSEHERIAEGLCDARDDAWAALQIERERFKKAITDLAAAREEVEVLKQDAERSDHMMNEATQLLSEIRDERDALRPDALAMRRKRERDRDRRKAVS